MKLHLPFGLRKALLACLAALTAHTLPLTVASGASLVGSAAVVSFLISQGAYAQFDESEWEDADVIHWSGYDWGSGEHQQNPDGYEAGQGWASWLQNAEKNVAGNKFIFDVDPALRFYTPGGAPTLTVRADLWLRRDMTITNGSSGTTWYFEGSIVGDGNINWNWNNTFAFVFRGNMEDWTGNITNTSSDNFSLAFEDGAVTGGGDITTNGALTINGATMNNASITARTLTLSGTSTLSAGTLTVNGATSVSANANINITQGEYILNGGLTTAAGSSITVQSGASLEHAGGTSSLTTGTLTLEKGSSLLLSGGSLTLGSGLGLTISGDGSAPALLTISGGAQLTLDVSLLADLNAADFNIVLDLGVSDYGNLLGLTLTGIENGVPENLLDFISSSNALIDGWGFVINEDGTVSLSLLNEVRDLVWAVDSNDDNIWNSSSQNWHWSGGLSATFASNDNVTFDAAQGEEVIIDEAGVVTGNMTIVQGDWTFSGGELTVMGALSVVSGSVEFSGTGAVSLSSNGLTVGTVEGDEVLTSAQVIISTTGTKNLGSVTINKGSEFVLQTLSELGNTTVTGAGSLVFDGLSATHANLTGGLVGDVAVANANSIGALVLRGGSSLSVGTNNNTKNALERFSSIVVEDGSFLEMGANQVLNGTGHTIHLSGFGGSNGYNAALRLFANAGATWNIGWNIEVDKSTGSAVSAVRNIDRLEWNGNIDASDTTFTIDAGAIMLYGSAAGATCTINAENGSVTLNAGDWFTFNGRMTGDNSELTIKSTSTNYNSNARNLAIQGSFSGENVTINFVSKARSELMNNDNLNFTGSGRINVKSAELLISKIVDGLKNYDFYLDESVQNMYFVNGTLTVRSLQGGVDENGDNIEGYDAKILGGSTNSGTYNIKINYSGTDAAVWAGTFWEPTATNNNFDRWVQVTKAGSGTQRFTAAQSRLRGLIVEAGTLDLAAGGTIGGGANNSTGALTLHGGGYVGLG